MGKRLWQIGFISLFACLLLLITLMDGEEKTVSLLNRSQLMDIQHGQIYNNNNNNVNANASRQIIVFIHIQKTGGSSFLAHLTSSMTVDGAPMCTTPSEWLKNVLNRKKDFVICPLERNDLANFKDLPEMWLASERTYGWICGVHPFMFEMTPCLRHYLNVKYGEKKRDFHFITMLRHPVMRYVSEFLHVSRGAKWFNKHNCDGRTMDHYMPPCYDGFYDGYSWKNVTFDKFTNCPSNWANNRQTIMLANLSSVNCLDTQNSMPRSKRDNLLLENAKANLKKMQFFGLSEYFIESCILFEKQFNVKFDIPCTQKQTLKLHSATLLRDIWSNRTLHNLIVHTNNLDMQLHEFALRLFATRLEEYNINVDHYKVDSEMQTIINKHHHTGSV